MKHRIFINSKQIFAIFFFALLIFGARASVFAQTTNQTAADDPDNKILADGNPPLREMDVKRAVSLYEWLFSAQFSYEQKDEFQAIVVSEWKSGNPATIKFIGDALALADSKNLIKKYAEREAVREKILPALIARMKSEMQDAKQQILRDVYRRAHGANSLGTIKTEIKVLKTGGTLKDIVGDWMLQSQTTPGNTVSAKFSFLANGRAQFGTTRAGQKAGCYVTEATIKEGTFTVSDSQVALEFPVNKTQRISSCQPNDIKTETLAAENQTFTWQIRRDAQEFVQLCLTAPNGASVCYRKTD